MSDEISRELEREHQARTLRTAAGTEPRLSRADEQVFAEREDRRRREESAAVEAEYQAEFRRRVTHAIAALEQVRHMVADDRSSVRFIDRCARWLRAQLS